MILIVLVILAIISFGANRCVNGASENTANNQATQNQATNQNTTPEPTVTAPPVAEIVATLPDTIEPEDKQALAERAQTNEDALWVAQHAAEYAFQGDYVQRKMLRLAANEPDALDFVRHVFDKYPAPSASPWDGTVVYGEVPHLYQWDTKWGWIDYCDTPFGMSGCCPTSFSMVAMALTGTTACTPAVAAADAEANGYAVSYEGTNGKFITERAADYGFYAYETFLSGGDLVTLLQQPGVYVIINVGPGDFTVAGHFIVATGVAADGSVIINDPYSVPNSNMTWDADRLIGQAITCFVCYA